MLSDAERYNLNRKLMKARTGKCANCSRLAVDGLTLCQVCRDKSNARHAKKRAAYGQAGLCKCGKATEPHYRQCVKCREYQRLRRIGERSI